MLVILETMAFIRWSQDSSSQEENAGEVCKMCRSLGMENEWHGMVMASLTYLHLGIALKLSLDPQFAVSLPRGL